MALPAVVVLGVLHGQGEGTFGNLGALHTVLLVLSGVATAVPLLLFAAAARRIPLSTVGLLQYLTPCMQLTIGVFVYGEPMPPVRLVGFALVWAALAVFTVGQPPTRPGGVATRRSRGGPGRPLTASRGPDTDRSGRPGGVAVLSYPGVTVAPDTAPAPGRAGTTGDAPIMTSDPHPEVSPPPAEGSGDASVQVQPPGLSRREHEMLTFERQWWRQAGAKETAIRDRFGVTPTRYYQVLNALVDRPDALAADPLLVRRLRRLRTARQRQRSVRGPVQ